MHASISYVCDILKQNHCYPLRIVYLARAFELLCRGESIVQAITIIQEIVHEYPAYDMHDETKVTQTTILQQANKQIELMNRTI